MPVCSCSTVYGKRRCYRAGEEQPVEEFIGPTGRKTKMCRTCRAYQQKRNRRSRQRRRSSADKPLMMTKAEFKDMQDGVRKMPGGAGNPATSPFSCPECGGPAPTTGGTTRITDRVYVRRRKCRECDFVFRTETCPVRGDELVIEAEDNPESRADPNLLDKLKDYEFAFVNCLKRGDIETPAYCNSSQRQAFAEALGRVRKRIVG